MISFSVVICSYNRKELLRLALDSLRSQFQPNLNTEIIVVDNNSTDGSLEFLNEYQDEYSNIPIRIIEEKKQGLSYARNRAYKEANFPYIAYMDDDAIATENWLQKVKQVIREQDPDVFGGPIYPYYLTEKPKWFKDEYEIRQHSSKTGWLNKEEFVSGSNMIIKKSWLEELDGFDTNFGMKGENIAYGEETDFIKRAREKGANTYYDLDLIMKHHVPAYKMTIPFFFEQQIKQAKYTHSINNIENNEFEVYSELATLHKELELFLESFNRMELFEKGESLPENNLIANILPLIVPLVYRNESFKKYKKTQTLKDRIRRVSIGGVIQKLKH
jgi:glycosyltransferase involved in cell wall biosynthesis